jgi:hypothetical protein
MQLQSRPVCATLVLLAGWLFSGAMVSQATAGQVKLRWDYTASGAAGFVLYCGPASRTYRTRIDVGNTDTYTIAILPEGATSYCAVTAYDPAKAESVYSNELKVFVPRSGAGRVRVVPVPRPVPASTNIGPQTQLTPALQARPKSEQAVRG